MIGDAGSDPPSTYERLRQDIIEGELAPGRPLVEAALAARYRVSRTPVREALRRLEQDGLVERVDRTMRVRLHSAEEILELYEVRTILETAAVRAAAERRTEFDVARLERLLGRMEAPDLPRDRRAPLNRDFHSALWRAGHNGVLVDTLERLYVHSLRYLHTTLTGQERWEASLRQHREILDAIAGGDGEVAGRRLADHLREARDIRLHLLEEQVRDAPARTP
jgi:DNA-binding GntR family transcriptional regulator